MPEPGLRLCGRAVSALAQGVSSAAPPSAEALGRAGKPPASCMLFLTLESNQVPLDYESNALPNELVVEKLEGLEPPTSGCPAGLPDS